MDPQRIETDACDGFEVGWGVTPDDRRVVLMTATRNGVAVGRPLGFQLDIALALVAQLERTIAFAKAWKPYKQ